MMFDTAELGQSVDPAEFAERELELRTRLLILQYRALELARFPVLIDFAGVEGARKRVSFARKLDLSRGRHVVTVAAQNLAGKIVSQKLTIHVDREGPTIAIENVRPGKNPDWIRIDGSVYDGAGVSVLFELSRCRAAGRGRPPHLS